MLLLAANDNAVHSERDAGIARDGGDLVRMSARCLALRKPRFAAFSLNILSLWMASGLR